MILDDTIVAVSSPQGVGGIRAIVRLSGPGAWAVAGRLCEAANGFAPGWRNVRLKIADLTVAGALLLFRAPRSFTGQDVAELHIPNSPALVALLLESLLAAGQSSAAVRLAEPGEFTARAFFNGKMDLTQAEGIAATINAGNAAQLRAAASLRQGDLHRWSHALADELGNLLALVEAGIDFSDEEGISFVALERLQADLTRLCQDIAEKLAAAVRIDRLALPPTIVFVGKPNVGKSSLINALSGTQRSLVSPVAGTTRDMLSATLSGPRGEVRLLDVPGEEAPTDELRQKMMQARENALLDADLIVEVLDHPAAIPAAHEFTAPHVTIWNKADLFPKHAPSAPALPAAPADWQIVSAKTGLHLPELRAALLARLTAADASEPGGASRLVLNHRHRALLQDSAHRLHAALALLCHHASPPAELLATELRQALDLLGQITGTISPDQVLGRIFSQFCIGK